MLSKKLNREKILHPALKLLGKSGRESKIIISGNSMKPMLPEGSQVVVEHRTVSIKTGNIIVFLRDNQLISHRVIRIKTSGGEKLYLTKGDSALRFDSPLVKEGEIVGVIKEVVKGKSQIDLSRRRWKIVGQALVVCSFMVGSFYNVAAPFLRLFLRGRKTSVTSFKN